MQFVHVNANLQENINTSIRGALGYLKHSRSRDGWWRDFLTSEGVSDEWVTAYVGSSLAESSCVEAQQLAQHAWEKLQFRRFWLSGWAYNINVPLDADSTIWALILGEKLKAKKTKRIIRAYQFVRSHMDQDGGISTYSPKSPIDKHIGNGFKTNVQGWKSSHICVSAAGASLFNWPYRELVQSYLMSNQSPEGPWYGYWWNDPEYVTSLAVEALKERSNDLFQPVGRSVVNWLSDRIQADGAIRTKLHPKGSPFATACAVSILLTCSGIRQEKSKILSSITWLLNNQLSDGSWISSASLRIPFPIMIDPNKYDNWRIEKYPDSGSIKLDQNSVFTAATVFKTLIKMERFFG